MKKNAWRAACVGLALALIGFELSCGLESDPQPSSERTPVAQKAHALAMWTEDCCAAGCSTAKASNVSGSCFGDGCTSGDAENSAGDCYGADCKAGSSGNAAGLCVGDGCIAGHAGNVGGDCVGDGCTAGNAGNVPGDCYAPNKNCTPGKSWFAGTAHDIKDAYPKYCCAKYPTYVHGKFSSKIEDQEGWNIDGTQRKGFDYYFYGQCSEKKKAIEALCKGHSSEFECPDDAWLNGDF